MERENDQSPLERTVEIALRSHRGQRDRAGRPCEAFVERTAADLADNMDVSRLRGVEASDLERLDRYVKAWQRLTGT